MIDYAKPLITIEALTKEVSNLCLHGDLKAAEENSVVLAAEVRLLVQTLKLMQESKQ